MVSGGDVESEPTRLDPAKLLAYPSPIDIDNDILVPQKADKFMVDMDAALDSRYLLAAVSERNPTMQEWIEWYGSSLSTADLMEAQEHDMKERQKKRKLAATQLVNLVKPQSLTQQEASQMLTETIPRATRLARFVVPPTFV